MLEAVVVLTGRSQVVDKMRENGPKSFGNVTRREETRVLRTGYEKEL